MASNHDDKSNMRKVALTSLAGTSIEWYDFFIYGTAAANDRNPRDRPSAPCRVRSRIARGDAPA